MNHLKTLVAAVFALTASMSSLAANSLTFQGVTFSTYAVDSDTLNLTISNATAATGDWAGITYLDSFALKNIGTLTSATMVSGPSFSNVVDNSNELNASGCGGGGSGGACFTFSPRAALTSSMSWNIDFTGSNLNFSLPHLKVLFSKSSNGGKAGSLLSQDLPVVTAVPETETYAMMLAGLGLMGAIVRRRKNKIA
jgi:hypothetical protein